MVSRHRERKPSGSYPRTARINELLREVLAEQLERLADSDERLRFATVTGVEVTTDIANATVFMGSIETELSRSLDEHRISLQKSIGRELRLKRTPRLQFVVDPAMVEGARVEEILRRLKSPADPPAGGEG
jgi:ribosome-binding factor A